MAEGERTAVAVLLAVALLALAAAKQTAVKKEKCKHCAFLAETFTAGLQKTSKDHFAGGDTAWEEKNLGKYRTSETRLIEVMEGVCKKKTLENADKYSGYSEIEFKCSALLEDHEESVESWYKEHQASTDLFTHLCVNELRRCCPDGRYGEACDGCPGVEMGAVPCFGHGECQGEGSREGTGKCSCSEGYTGHACQHCHSNFFPLHKTDTSIECSKCDESCAGGCSGHSEKDCMKCATGWRKDEDGACRDVDECKEEGENGRCRGGKEVCINTKGSFRCECEEGYVRGKEGNCEVDVIAEPQKKENEEEEDSMAEVARKEEDHNEL